MTQDTVPEASLPELLRVSSDPSPVERETTVDELDDEDFAPPPPRRTSRVTVGLGALAVLALGFLGGALVQKHDGTSTTAGTLAARAGRARGAFAGAGGAGAAGGFGGFGGAGAGTAAGAGAGTTGTGAAGGAGTGADAGAAATTPGPVAIGTVVSVTGNTLVVKDLGGKTHTLTLGSGVTLTVSSPLTTTSLKPGDNVTVDGTTAAGATTVTTVVRHS